MADDIKIRIVADNEKAIDNIEKLSSVFDKKLVPSINEARKSLKEAQKVGATKMASDAYIKSVQAMAEQNIAFAESSKDYAKAMEIVRKEAKTALSSGMIDTYKQLADVLGQYRDKYNEILKLEGQEAKESEANAKAKQATINTLVSQMEEYANAIRRAKEERDLLFNNSVAFYDQGQGWMGQNIHGTSYGDQKETYEQMWGRLLDEKDLNTAKEYRDAIIKSRENMAKMVKHSANVTANTKKSENAIVKFGSKLVDTTKNILIFRSVMTITNDVINKTTQFFADSIKVASQAEQVYSKLNTVFGEYSGALSVANNLAAGIGVSTQTSANALSTIGDLLQAQGDGVVQSLQTATKWAKDFADIIAFKDIDMSLEEFAQNFMSGTAGNLRNFRTFGSIVRESAVQAKLMAEGLDQLTGSELELAKMTARAEIALDQQKNAMGATEREWDTMLSVTRRYDEAIKQVQEDIGKRLVGPLKIVKELWTSLLDNAHRELTVEDIFNTSSFKDIPTGILNTSMKEFSQAIGRTVGPVTDDNLSGIDVEQLTSVIRAFAATKEEVIEAFGYLGGNQSVLASIDEAFATNEDYDKFLSDQERFKSIIETVDKNMESLQSIIGVNFVDSKWYKDFLSSIDGAEMDGAKIVADISGQIPYLFKKALEDAEGDIAKLGESATDILFGKKSNGDAIQMKIDAYEQLYRTMESTGRYTKEQLEEVYLLWQAENDELKKYNDQLKLVEDVTNAIGKGFSNAGSNLAFEKDVDSWMKGNGWSEEYAKAYVTALNLYKTTVDQAKLIENEDKRTKAINDANAEWFKTISDLKAYYEYIEGKAKKIAEETEQTNALNAMVAGWEASDATTADYRKQLAQLRMDDFEKTIADLNESIEKAAAEMDLGLVDSLEKQKEAFIKLTEATEKLEEEERKRAEIQAKKDAFFGPLEDSWNLMKGIGGSIWESMKGVWNGAIDATKGTSFLYSLFAGPAGAISGAVGGGAGSMLGGVGGGLSFLAEIATQTEAFQKLTNIVNDYIVPVLDAFLEPLLPIIDYIGKFLQDVLMSFLDWFYPLFNALCAGIALVAGYVEGIFNFIQEGIRWVIGTIVDGIMNVVDAILPGKQSTPEWAKQWAAIDPWNNMLKKFDEANETAEKILGQTFEINKNTETNDYATYVDLYKRGMLSKENFFSATGANKYSSSTTTNGVTITSGSKTNATYVQIQGLVLKVSDYEDFKEQFKKDTGLTLGYS